MFTLYQNRDWNIVNDAEQIVYNRDMGKRNTGVGKMKTSHSKKTQKRLAIKREMLAKKASKRRK